MDRKLFQNLYPFDVLLKDRRKLYALFPYADTTMLEKLLNDFPENGVAVEIGTWTGFSTCLIGSIVKEKHGHLSTIDSFVGLPDVENDGSQVRGILNWNLDRCGIKDTVTVLDGASDEFVSKFKDESIDFMFIDGDHRYSQISKDIRNWLPKIKTGGIMSGHDFDCTLFKEDHIETDCVNRVHHGVAKAVLELAKTQKVQFFKEGETVVSSIWFITKAGAQTSPAQTQEGVNHGKRTRNEEEAGVSKPIGNPALAGREAGA